MLSAWHKRKDFALVERPVKCWCPNFVGWPKGSNTSGFLANKKKQLRSNYVGPHHFHWLCGIKVGNALGVPNQKTTAATSSAIQTDQTSSSIYTPWNQQFAPENRPGPKRKLVFQPSIFRCELLVSGRVNAHTQCFLQVSNCASFAIVATHVSHDHQVQKYLPRKWPTWASLQGTFMWSYVKLVFSGALNGPWFLMNLT